MKITLDVDQLLEEKKITKSQYNTLIKLSSKSTGSLGINILIAFGVLAVVGGMIALAPSLATGYFLSILGLFLGFGIQLKEKQNWGILGNILLTMGALGLATCLGTSLSGEPRFTFLLISLIFIAIGILAKNGLLIAFSALTMAPLMGAGTEYFHASYFLFIDQPIVTVIVYTILAIGVYLLSKKVPSDYEKLCIIFSRTSIIMINMGFWIASLWGDKLFNFSFTDEIMSLLWAFALITTAIWGAKNNKRFVVNAMASFGAIHFYTQWFERLGADPTTLLVAGISAIFFGVFMWKYNKSLDNS